MTPFVRLTILAIVACAHAQYSEERAPRYIASEPKETPAPPVAILKQINRHNEDGSYTYGYESGDGSFKIETKSPTGEVKGKYGYKDDTGKLRVIEYGANKFGFQPAGEGITVAPPTLVDETTREDGLRPNKQQQQSIDYDYEEPAPRPAPRRPPQAAYRAPSPPPQQYRPAPQQQEYRPAPQQQQYRPAPQQASYKTSSAPVPPKPAFFAGAAPVPVDNDNNNFLNSEPQPRQQQYRPKQDFRPAPQPQQFAPRHTEVDFNQNYSPAPQQFPPANQYPQQKNQPYSMLDELLKEYALPKGGSAAVHDITFGSY
ncbi:uncharacterized protein LOC126968038 [Leptidea sinapis]|uniref:Uncharacterized protein n=1 Tax=Leptidea sinapis TaxID=189913 RepID=A0A5E4R071_9NEOP|nr:uncharacterized protein LOC126968038 [Leptidea sinapis]VVD03329.1 unnamed protein product [Leptidea sinapis]